MPGGVRPLHAAMAGRHGLDGVVHCHQGAQLVGLAVEDAALQRPDRGVVHLTVRAHRNRLGQQDKHLQLHRWVFGEGEESRGVLWFGGIALIVAACATLRSLDLVFASRDLQDLLLHHPHSLLHLFHRHWHRQYLVDDGVRGGLAQVFHQHDDGELNVHREASPQAAREEHSALLLLSDDHHMGGVHAHSLHQLVCRVEGRDRSELRTYKQILQRGVPLGVGHEQVDGRLLRGEGQVPLQHVEVCNRGDHPTASALPILPALRQVRYRIIVAALEGGRLEGRVRSVRLAAVRRLTHRGAAFSGQPFGGGLDHSPLHLLQLERAKRAQQEPPERRLVDLLRVGDALQLVPPEVLHLDVHGLQGKRV
mmetsp:Transcript_14542/g.31153  ORF Transcript_14542/g.31153 Transcript_14542/m.31153 type:complete len:365 (-) Transcript_14542:1700-2794(-)